MRLTILAALGLAACGGGYSQSDTTDTGAAPMGFMGAQWSASLSAQPGSPNTQITGTGTVTGNSDSTRTKVEVTLNGAAPSASLPWHLHRGTCGNDQGIVGEPANYAPLSVSSEGRATGTATLDLPMPRTGEYMINVHASSADMSTIVACGNLTGPTGG
jgi:hypothetical protein